MHIWAIQTALSILLISIFSIIAANDGYAQKPENIQRIEFNSGARSFRQQVILTPDSVLSIEEDFRKNDRPVVKFAKMTSSDWNALTKALEGVELSTIDQLKSPTDKRTYDAAAHGSIIITLRGNKTYTHGFDDKTPHEKLMPLMKAILHIRNRT